MAGLQDVALRIPDKWSPTWFRSFVVEVLAKADVRNAEGSGVTVSSDGNSVATISTDAAVEEALAAHVADPFTHGNLMTVHLTNTDPHPVYVRRGESESMSYFLGD